MSLSWMPDEEAVWLQGPQGGEGNDGCRMGWGDVRTCVHWGSQEGVGPGVRGAVVGGGGGGSPEVKGKVPLPVAHTHTHVRQQDRPT